MTNSIPPEVIDAVKAAVPQSYWPWVWLGLVTLPFATRLLYALYAGRGAFGAVHGVLFGTNETKTPKTP